VIIKYWYSKQTEDYYHWIDLLGLSEPTNRNWTGEDKVNYFFLFFSLTRYIYNNLYFIHEYIVFLKIVASFCRIYNTICNVLICFPLQNYITYREFLLYLEEYQKINIAELRTQKMRTRPTPPNSPPKDCSPLPPERTRTDSNQNYCCVDSYSLGKSL